MKLVTKISIAAVSLLLVFSQFFSLWALPNSHRQILSNIVEDEWDRLLQDTNDLSSAVSEKKLELDSDKASYARILLLSRFSENAVLYYQGEELANSSPYEFFPEKGSPLSSWYSRILRSDIRPDQIFLERAGEKYLLILYLDFGPFRLLHYRDISSVYQETGRLLFQGIAVALFLATLFVFLLILVIRRILKPFYCLRDTANVIADGVYTARVPHPGKDEVGEVAAAFNRMAGRVEEHVRELADHNEKQRQLIGSLAHELKTPMTAIQGYAELLRRVELSPARFDHALGYMEEECKRLSRLSVKMLELARLSGETSVEKVPLKISSLFAHVRDTVHCKLAQKHLRLEIRTQEGLEISGDWDLLVIFLDNLLDNAAKASQEGGRIYLTGSREGLFVQDEGRGIPREELSRITEPFYMADKSRSRKEGGAGLGLSLCSQIARLHGAELEIQSRKGQGTRIGLRW